ncbi:excinuclease ABC subunit UvrC [Mycoplasma hafezii]|uniref:excinuclease ABC subunit UvrC n=1 Tax=Mycoplasma hafezii TaxID=525886 RepID=UPI003CE6B58F
MQNEVLQKLKNVPKKPGVYLWKNKLNEVIYVGKAKNLFNRMHQYFEGSINSYKTQKMVSEITDFDFFVCLNEQEALILEKNYIEIHRPPYNLLLLDDKRYPYICVKLTNKLSITREFRIGTKNATASYYGPFVKSGLARTLTHILQRLFLYNQGILIEKDSYENWKNKYNQATELLKLKDNSFVELLTSKMHQAAESWNFELANEYKQAISLISEMKDTQVAELSQTKNVDVFSFIETDKLIWVYVVMYRYGVQVAHEKFTLENIGVLNEIISKFLEQFYATLELPDKLVFDKKFKNLELDFNYANRIAYPEKGVYLDVINRANYNNEVIQKDFENEYLLKKEASEQVKKDLEQILNQGKPINNIFLFDNSNLNNSFIVGVVVAYKDLKKNKSMYRKFNHNEFAGALRRKSDVEYMYLTIARFLNQFKSNLTANDVFIVDGGKQQINEALYALKEANLSFNIPVFGLVKNEHHQTRELIDATFKKINVSQNVFNFLAQMQEEVDRFAKDFMRKKHLASSFSSKLTQIKGIGPKMEAKLLEHFKTYNNIYNASFSELEKVTNKKVAKLIVENFSNKS